MGDAAVLDLTIGNDDDYAFGSYIVQATDAAQAELGQLDDIIALAERLQPECDQLDYALAAGSGALCGVIDIFCVGAPGDSKLQGPALQWMRHTTVTFAKLCGWNGEQTGIQSAAAFLATKFLADSDSPLARKLGLLFDEDIDPESRAKSFRVFGRESSLLGVFFAILGEFATTAPAGDAGKLHFVHDKDAGAGLHGSTPAEKVFCGIVNWLGHQLFGRGDAVDAMQQAMPALGIPTPVWTLISQYAMHARDIPLPAPKFLERFQQLANQIYAQGYDVRFLATQSVPVLLNEALTRLFYAVRRMFAYADSADPSDFSMQAMWEACEPFSNSTVQRMLTVAHGTFCLLDTTDAAIRGVAAGAGTFNVREFVMRLNLVGTGRFAISLYGEGVRAVALQTAGPNAEFARRERTIVEDYLDGLRELGRLYDDRHLVDFTEDFKHSAPYERAFAKSVQLAQLRKVPEERILASKSDIDAYFNN
ncbi:MAG: hypothetical protein KH404_02135 [Bifidobacterium pseudolongum]|nr:hypothetical protein [Bifidobacterium pseudolongum]